MATKQFPGDFADVPAMDDDSFFLVTDAAGATYRAKRGTVLGANLDAIAGLNFSANEFIYVDADGNLAKATISGAGRGLVAQNFADMRGLLSLTLATDEDAAAGEGTGIPNSTQVALAIAAQSGSDVNSGVLDATNGGANDLDAIEYAVTLASPDEIVVKFKNLSATGNDNFLFQFSTGGAYVTTGYNARTWANSGSTFYSTGFPVFMTAGLQLTGEVRFKRFPESDFWYVGDVQNRVGSAEHGLVGQIDLGGEVDGVRVITEGSANFDDGAVYFKEIG